MSERFVGRQAELESLMRNWHEVTTEGKPRVVALLGESGVGKTRLVQAFYAKLAEMHRSPEGHGYWPDELDVAGRNLTVNPALSAVDTSEVPPFLWWGLRITDPLQSEAVFESAVRSALPLLIPHLEPMNRARALRRAWLEGGIEVGAALSGYIPVIGSTLEVALAGFELFGVIRGAWSDPKLAPKAASERVKRDLINIVVSDLSSILRPRGREHGLPMVLIVDDAQFASRDPSSVELLEKLLQEAHRLHWSLLVVVTYWREPWALDWRNPAKGGSIAAVIREHHVQQQPDWQPLEITVMPPLTLEPWLRDRLPGITPDQVRLLLERAGGQPRFLDELTRHCLGQPNLFEGSDPTSALSEPGLTHLLAASTDLSQLVLTRLHSAPPTVARFVTLSSLQGMRVLRHITERVAERLNAQGLAEIGRSAFADSQDPHAYLAQVHDAIAEFTQRVFFEVAREHLADLFDDQEAQQALLDTLAELVLAPLSDWAEEEIALALSIAAESLANAGPERRGVGVRAWVRLLQLEHARDEPRAAESAALRIVRSAINEDFSLTDLSFAEWRVVQQALLLSQVLGVHETVARGLMATATTPRERAIAMANDPTQTQLEARLASIEAWEQIAAQSGDRTDYLALADAHHAVTNLVRSQYGDAANRHSQAALSLYETHGRGEVEIRRHSLILVAFGEEAMRRADPAVARSHYERALAMRERLHREAPTRASTRSLAVTHERVGSASLALGDLHAAALHFGHSLEMFRRLHQEVGTQDAQRNYGIALQNVAEVEWQRQQRPAAIDRMRLALELQAAISGGPVAGDGAWDTAERYQRFMQMMLAEGNPRSALHAAERAVEYRRALARSRPNPGPARELAEGLELTATAADILEQVDRAQRDRAEASAVRRSALATVRDREGLSASDIYNIGLTQISEAIAQARSESYEAARLLAKTAVMELEALSERWSNSDVNDALALGLETLARIDLALGDAHRALAPARKAVAIREVGRHRGLVGNALLHHPDALALLASIEEAVGERERAQATRAAAHEAYEAFRTLVGDMVIDPRLA